ncbi:hypothetical protein XCR_1819 [Xanthomonas campestris pv. raphani 756C]|nr:hypothetical protein XCR_1819 [Xanthomonas campestris pv. raphani 756C]
MSVCNVGFGVCLVNRRRVLICKMDRLGHPTLGVGCDAH